MARVIALVQNEESRYDFLNNFGSVPYISTMCMATTSAIRNETKLFRFEVFGLFTNDTKVNNLIKERDGIVILFSFINQKTIDRIVQIVDANPNTPILLVYEKIVMFANSENLTKYFNESFLEKYNVKHRKIVTSNEKMSEAKNWFYRMMQNIEFTKPKEIVETINSKTININEMVTQFENATLPLSLWDHYGRLRIVNYYLNEYGYEKTIDINGPLCKAWKKYKTTIGHEKLWNYTLTRFWINILYSLHKKEPQLTFSQLYDKYTQIQYGSFFKKYYSEDILFSQYAKDNWVSPNLINMHQQE